MADDLVSLFMGKSENICSIQKRMEFTCHYCWSVIWIVDATEPNRRRQTLKTVDRRLTWPRFSLNFIKYIFTGSTTRYVSCSISSDILWWKTGNGIFSQVEIRFYTQYVFHIVTLLSINRFNLAIQSNPIFFFLECFSYVFNIYDIRYLFIDTKMKFVNAVRTRCTLVQYFLPTE